MPRGRGEVAGGTDGHDVGVDHHKRQPSISFQGVEVTERHDGGSSPLLQRKVVMDRTLCWLQVPSRWLQRLNLLKAIPSHPTNRRTESPARLAQCLMNWTTESRGNSGKPKTPFKSSPKLFF